MINKILMMIRFHMIDIVSVFFLLVAVSYFVGYYMNGLYGTKFELNSIGMVIGALSGAGFLSTIKYVTDSCKNSLQGERPEQQVSVDKE